MTSDVIKLPVGRKATKKKSRWRVTAANGQVYLVEGTSVATEEGTMAVHVYDGSECVLIVQDGRTVEIVDDERLKKLPKPRKKGSK